MATAKKKITMPPADDGDDEHGSVVDSGVKHKPHYFELSLRSVSHGVLNQEVPIVREYALTSGQLAFKQMTFVKSPATQKIVAAVVEAMDGMSMPFQEIGKAEIAKLMEDMAVESK